MNLTKIDVGTKIWFEGQLCTVVSKLEPTKLDQYLLVERNRDLYPCEIEDGRPDPAIELILIRCEYEEFYLDDPIVRGYIKQINKDHSNIHKFLDILSKQYYETFFPEDKL